MNVTKRISALLLSLTLAAASLPLSADAAPNLPRPRLPEELPAVSAEPLAVRPPAQESTMAVTAGSCGENLYWSLDGNDLTITGTGDMTDFGPNDPAPWCESAFIIHSITMAEGVTSIGDQAFSNCHRLLDCFIPASVTSVGSDAFTGVSSGRLYFLGDAPEFAEDALYGFDFMAFHFRPWDDSALQSYGGEPMWKRGTVILSSVNKQLYGLNEQLRAEDLIFQAYAYEQYPFPYTPGTVTLGEYDNSTYGHKSVAVNADGFELTYEYDVTDGESHLQQLHVEYEPIQYYRGYPIYVDPVVMAEDRVLPNEYYAISYENNMEVGTASFTITGLGIYDGFCQTYPFAILKTDLEGAYINMEDTEFYGMPMEPEVAVYHNGFFLDPETDYTVVYENNVNVGQGVVRIIGKGGYCGEISRTFDIRQSPTEVYLDGAYNGSAYDGVFNDEVYYFEGLLPPAPFTGIINCPRAHAAYYMFYEVRGEEAVLLDEYETVFGAAGETCFTYDFTDVYESYADEGGAVFMLAYSWMDIDYDVYSGVCVMFIPAKVPGAASMVMESAGSGLGREYLTVYSDDGALEPVTWSVSDETAASVEGGTVTLLAPGTVTVTARSGGLTASREITAQALSLDGGEIFDSEGTVIYDGQLLTEGVHYTLTVTEENGVTQVAAAGKGLFTGQLLRQFDESGKALGHTHTFAYPCDDTCGGCDFTKASGHSFGGWVKDGENHWHVCAVCGEIADLAPHTPDPADPTACAVCGPLYVPGDLDGSGIVNEDDALYLLSHVLMPEFFPVSQSVDYTADGQINEDDALYLLSHVLMPEFFPLTGA